MGATLARGDVDGRRSFGITGRARRPDGLGAIVGVGRTPNLSFWYELNNTWAATASVSYTYPRPMLRIDVDQSVYERRLSIGATRIGVGFARRVF